MWISLGYITGAANTPIRITMNLEDPTEGYLCHAIFVQQVRTNTGFILVGREHLDETTGVDLNAVLAVPTDNSLPSAMIGISEAPNALNASEYWISLTQGADKCLASLLVL